MFVDAEQQLYLSDFLVQVAQIRLVNLLLADRSFRGAQNSPGKCGIPRPNAMLQLDLGVLAPVEGLHDVGGGPFGDHELLAEDAVFGELLDLHQLLDSSSVFELEDDSSIYGSAPPHKKYQVADALSLPDDGVPLLESHLRGARREHPQYEGVGHLQEGVLAEEGVHFCKFFFYLQAATKIIFSDLYERAIFVCYHGGPPRDIVDQGDLPEAFARVVEDFRLLVCVLLGLGLGLYRAAADQDDVKEIPFAAFLKIMYF